MEQQEELENSVSQPAWLNEATAGPPPQPHANNMAVPQHGAGGCACGKTGGTCSCGGATTPGQFVYALGRVEARFPSPAIEKEFAQATARADTAGATDGQAFHTVLAERENRYLARQMCYVLKIEGIETYLLAPRDPADLDLLIAAIRPTTSPLDLDCIIGTRGGIAPATMCNGLLVPIVVCDQIYSFDRDILLNSVPPPTALKGEQEKTFRAAAGEVFDRLMLMTDNAGATDEHRALNYLAVRYPAIYARAAQAFEHNAALSAVEVRPSALSGVRRIMEVIFSYTNRNTDVTEKHFTRVDVTEAFPFLVTKLGPYFDR